MLVVDRTFLVVAHTLENQGKSKIKATCSPRPPPTPPTQYIYLSRSFSLSMVRDSVISVDRSESVTRIALLGVGAHKWQYMIGQVEIGCGVYSEAFTAPANAYWYSYYCRPDLP